MFIRTNPKDKVFEDLIDLAFEISDEFILVVREDIGVSDNLKQVLEQLKPSLKVVKEQFEWPGTTYSGEKPVLVYYYHINNHTKEILKKASNSLYDWIQPKLPEDLSFLKNNKAWLTNTPHENESYIIIDDDETIMKILQIKGLNIRV